MQLHRAGHRTGGRGQRGQDGDGLPEVLEINGHCDFDLESDL